jgi:hypothetical protein
MSQFTKQFITNRTYPSRDSMRSKYTAHAGGGGLKHLKAEVANAVKRSMEAIDELQQEENDELAKHAGLS